MTREEAEKMAQKHVKPIVDLWRYDLKHLAKRDLINSFMACYDMMTQGKPDGFCARHSSSGWDPLTFDEIRSESEKLSLGAYATDEDNWRVVPVKLIEVKE